MNFVKFLNTDKNDILYYLPFGITTLEMIINDDIKGGYLKTKNKSNSADNLCVGYADETKDIMVIWGGGREKGLFVDPSSNKRLFLQIIHQRNDYYESSISFEHNRHILSNQKLRLLPFT